MIKRSKITITLHLLLLFLITSFIFQARVFAQEGVEPTEELPVEEGKVLEIVETSSLEVEVPDIQPVTITKVQDKPHDEGKAIEIYWEDKSKDLTSITGYEVLRADSPDGSFNSVTVLAPGSYKYTDRVEENEKEYFYTIKTHFA